MKTLLFILITFPLFSQSSENNLETVETFVYPNPSGIGKFNVVAVENATFTLYSTSGTYIGKWDFGDSKEIVIENIPQGFYQAIIEKEGKFVYKKIVIL
ncbi:MAG: T9SS type A sorting domain-containing protein [Flavobacteriia bacterium]|nr:T9SS type A sorting domain-containing protein [Flavobacteriia bacterium]